MREGNLKPPQLLTQPPDLSLAPPSPIPPYSLIRWASGGPSLQWPESRAWAVQAEVLAAAGIVLPLCAHMLQPGWSLWHRIPIPPGSSVVDPGSDTWQGWVEIMALGLGGSHGLLWGSRGRTPGLCSASRQVAARLAMGEDGNPLFTTACLLSSSSAAGGGAGLQGPESE